MAESAYRPGTTPAPDFRSVDVSDVHTPYAKIAHGASGESIPTSTADPLPTRCVPSRTTSAGISGSNAAGDAYATSAIDAESAISVSIAVALANGAAAPTSEARAFVQVSIDSTWTSIADATVGGGTTANASTAAVWTLPGGHVYRVRVAGNAGADVTYRVRHSILTGA